MQHEIALRGAVDIDQCEEVSRPAGTGLLQAKSHLDPSTSAESNSELAWRPRHVVLSSGRLQEVESESDLAILGESWQGALQLQEPVHAICAQRFCDFSLAGAWC